MDSTRVTRSTPGIDVRISTFSPSPSASQSTSTSLPQPTPNTTQDPAINATRWKYNSPKATLQEACRTRNLAGTGDVRDLQARLTVFEIDASNAPDAKVFEEKALDLWGKNVGTHLNPISKSLGLPIEQNKKDTIISILRSQRDTARSRSASVPVFASAQQTFPVPEQSSARAITTSEKPVAAVAQRLDYDFVSRKRASESITDIPTTQRTFGECLEQDFANAISSNEQPLAGAAQGPDYVLPSKKSVSEWALSPQQGPVRPASVHTIRSGSVSYPFQVQDPMPRITTIQSRSPDRLMTSRTPHRVPGDFVSPSSNYRAEYHLPTNSVFVEPHTPIHKKDLNMEAPTYSRGDTEVRGATSAQYRAHQKNIDSGWTLPTPCTPRYHNTREFETSSRSTTPIQYRSETDVSSLLQSPLLSENAIERLRSEIEIEKKAAMNAGLSEARSDPRDRHDLERQSRVQDTIEANVHHSIARRDQDREWDLDMRAQRSSTQQPFDLRGKDKDITTLNETQAPHPAGPAERQPKDLALRNDLERFRKQRAELEGEQEKARMQYLSACMKLDTHDEEVDLLEGLLRSTNLD